MKIIFLVSSSAIVYYMRYDPVISSTYDRRQDTFRYVFLVVPCLLLALMVHNLARFTEVEYGGWTGGWSRGLGGG